MIVVEILTLNYFVVIVEEGSISAARKLSMSQANFSQQMKQLEQRLDSCLFKRGSRTITLTYEGEYLFREAKKILSLHDELKIDFVTKTKKVE